ncbi:MAG: hypothetical protein PWQ44_825 [Methanolobus sp.]|nr:hypothetical protein [Methanolobus sp.]
MAKNKKEKIETLILLLNEAKSIRDELIDHINCHREHLWNLIKFSILIIGVYVTLALHLLEDNQNIYCLSFVLSAFLIIIALLLSFYSVAPKTLSRIIDQDELYGYTAHTKSKTLLELLQTHLVMNKRFEYTIYKNAIIRFLIHYIIVISLIDYLLFIMSIVFKSVSLELNLVSLIVFTLSATHMEIYSYFKYMDSMKLKEELNIS